jgi:exodeoxyribonuclease VII small subunit
VSNGKSFKEAYGTLQKHAQRLRSQQEPDIDNLTTIVSESVDAFKVCKERIDAVEKALQQALGNAPIEGGTEVEAQAEPPSLRSPPSREDDDNPY